MTKLKKKHKTFSTFEAETSAVTPNALGGTKKQSLRKTKLPFSQNGKF